MLRKILNEPFCMFRYRRHILQAIDLEKLLKHNTDTDQDVKARGGEELGGKNADFERGGNLTLGGTLSGGPRPTEGEQCSMIPPGLHGRFPVTLSDIPRWFFLMFFVLSAGGNVHFCQWTCFSYFQPGRHGKGISPTWKGGNIQVSKPRYHLKNIMLKLLTEGQGMINDHCAEKWQILVTFSLFSKLPKTLKP